MQLQRLAAKDLEGLPVVAVSPDPAATTREGLPKIEKEHGVRFTHRFVSDESVLFGRRYGLKRDTGASQSRPPTLVLLDARGEEVWHYTESHYQVRPIAPLVKEALERLHARAPDPAGPKPPGPKARQP